MTNQKPKTPKFDFDSVFDTRLYMKFYSTALDERAENEFNFIKDVLELKPKQKLLDLACGYGRHTNRFAKLGCEVIGIDKYTGFLDIAKKNAKKMGVKINYIAGDMRELDYTDEFNTVTLLFTAFGYFDDDENYDVLKRIFKSLKVGGQFMLDIQNKDNILRSFRDTSIEEVGDELMISRHTYEPSTGRMINNRFYISEGRKIDSSHFVRVYSVPEISMILESVGFKIESIYGGYDKEMTVDVPKSRRIIVVAKK